jgi:hypothetical protein
MDATDYSAKPRGSLIGIACIFVGYRVRSVAIISQLHLRYRHCLVFVQSVKVPSLSSVRTVRELPAVTGDTNVTLSV